MDLTRPEEYGECSPRSAAPVLAALDASPAATVARRDLARRPRRRPVRDAGLHRRRPGSGSASTRSGWVALLPRGDRPGADRPGEHRSAAAARLAPPDAGRGGTCDPSWRTCGSRHGPDRSCLTSNPGWSWRSAAVPTPRLTSSPTGAGWTPNEAADGSDRTPPFPRRPGWAPAETTRSATRPSTMDGCGCPLVDGRIPPGTGRRGGADLLARRGPDRTAAGRRACRRRRVRSWSTLRGIEWVREVRTTAALGRAGPHRSADLQLPPGLAGRGTRRHR
ncbi:hypothetical protein HBB16_20040 [Pseudonocardia sp. MCCB 268]|nr:hypothetical protein [Pseudonocardia cytotoxica]